MLQTLREQQKLLMIIVFVIVVVAFGFLYNASDTGLGRGGGKDANVLVRIDSKPILGDEYGKITGQIDRLELLSGMQMGMQTEDQESIARFLTLLALAGPISPETTGFTRDTAQRNQVTNLLTLREYAAEQGIAISPKDVSLGITRLPLLWDPNSGEFSRDRLALLIGQGSPGLPMPNGGVVNFSSLGNDPEALLRGIVRDWLTFEAVSDALAPASFSSPELEQLRGRLVNAQTEAWTITTELGLYLPEEDEPTDEEALEAWYAQNATAFLSPETRTVLLAVGQTKPTASEPSNDLLEGEDTPLRTKGVDEDAWTDLRARYNAFYHEVVDGADFTESAEEAGLEVLRVENVSRENTPDALADDEQLLELALDANLEWTISQAIEEESKGRIVALRVLDVVEPKPRDLDAVRKRAETAFHTEQARIAMNQTLAAERQAIEAAWEENQSLESFEVSDERISLEGPRYFGGAGGSNPLDAASRAVPIGKLTETTALDPQNSQVGFALVSARRLAEDEVAEIENNSGQMVSSSEVALRERLLIDWFARGRRVLNVYVPGAREDNKG